MYLQSLATAFPEKEYTQKECLRILSYSEALRALKARSRQILEKVLRGDSGIETRRLSPSHVADVLEKDAGGLHRIFEEHAPSLAAQALQKACDTAGVTPSEIDALLICTCTGYLCHGLSSHVSERLGMRPDAFLQDLLGLGCGAALPMLEAARGIATAKPGTLIATVAVEVSSAAFYIDDDPGVLISLCLFGDGAAACLWKSETHGTQFRFSNFRTIHKPEHREKIRFVNANGKLKNQLHRSVPLLAAEAVKELYDLRSRDPEKVIAHTGGRDVVEALESILPNHRLDETREVLRRYGNISSPSVLVALGEALKTSAQSLWLTAFGAGFSAHSCELTKD